MKKFQVEKEFPLLGIAAYAQFNYIAVGYKNAAEELLKDNHIRDWIIGEEQHPEEIIAFMESVRKENGLLDASLVSDLTEKYYGTDGRILQLSPENEVRDGWYYHYRDTAEKTNIDSWFYPETGIVGLFVNIPIIAEDGRFLGVTGGGINATVFDSVLKYFENNWNIDLYIIRNDGHIVYATDKALFEADHTYMDKKLNSSAFEQISREKLNRSGVILKPEGDKEGLVWASYMPEWESFLIIERSSKEQNVIVSSMVRRALAVEGPVTVILFLMIFLLFRKVFRMSSASLESGLSYIHKLQSVVYIQDAMLKTSSKLLSEIGNDLEIKRFSFFSLKAVERALLNEQTSSVLKLTASSEFSDKQMQKINLNDMVEDVLFKLTPIASECGGTIMGKMPEVRLIIRSNGVLLRFCIEHMVKENLNSSAHGLDIILVAGSDGFQIWLDIVFSHLQQNDYFDMSMLSQILKMLKIKFSVKDYPSGRYVFKLEFQLSGE